MNALNAITIFGKEIEGWTLETALFWLLFAIVVITIFMVAVFAVLLHRIGRRNAEKVAEELVEYGITVNAPEGLPAMQVALINGQNQVGLAVPLVDGRATLHAVPGDYTVKLFGLPENYIAETQTLSANERQAMVEVTEKPVEEAPVAPVIVYGGAVNTSETVNTVKSVGTVAAVEQAPVVMVDYDITVNAPEELSALQVALLSGSVQVGSAVNVEEGKAVISAPAGDYTVKVFGIPDDDYTVSAELLSADKPYAVVTIDYCEDYYEDYDEDVEESESEEDEQPVEADTAEEAETVGYVINVVAPVELQSLQVALYNGNVQVGEAVNVENRMAVINAPAGDYYVKVFCLPDDDYVVSVELLSAEITQATVVITYCDDYNDNAEEVEEEVLTVAEVVENVEPELVEYTVNVEAPENLPAIQVALVNGDDQIGAAVNVIDGVATIMAESGHYTVKVFGLSEDEYEVETDLLSEEKLTATVKITAIVEEVVEEYVPEPVEVVEVKPEPIEYNVIVEAPEGLPALQIALLNGDMQVGLAVNVENGKAVFNEEAGDYALKVFGLPEGYEVSAETLSEIRTTATVKITAPVVETPQVPEVDPLIIEEESFDGGILRYDRSFKARYIQSDNEVKGWYTDLKNELLSYKKVKDRLSWKRESYNFGRNPVARLAFRGNTLCLYLPLDPAEYAESKYKVESVEDNATYIDTPCLYRIKNDKRVRYAKELIATVTEKLGAVKVERDSVDYYEPYEGLVQLINKGLIKRNIKDKSAEAIFVAKKSETDFGRAEEIAEVAVAEDENK